MIKGSNFRLADSIENNDEGEADTAVKESLLHKVKSDFTPDLTTYGIKLGWIQGVLIPCLLNIWGVMLFLRIAWVVAQAGLGITIVIILLSSFVCVITALSLSAICTNGILKGGGVYYIVSRSLGAEFGASVGIIFAFANAVAASMNTIGFCESLNDLLKNHNLKIIDNGENDIRIVGTIALLVMCFICAVGMDWESKAQNFLIVIIVSAIANYIIGSCVGPLKESQKAKGFVGINGDTAAINWAPNFRFSEGRNHDFFSIFAIYFPAVTGVQAGANICGDLRDPGKAIPKGTLMALLISGSSYFIMAVLCGLAAMRDASGSESDLLDGKISDCVPDCPYGLHNNYEIMHLMSLWGPLIYAGCWAATLSTALTNLLSVPRLIQALGTDRIYPGLIFFSKPYGRHGEPYRGYVLVFVVSLLFLLIADLNTIAPLITNFYLASYALINFCTFHASFVKHLSWRPTFKFYNTWLSLVGFAMCVSIMIVISWITALITVFLFFFLYLIVHYRRPAANWGGSNEGRKYMETITQVLTMTRKEEIVKMYSPQPLVLTGDAYTHIPLLDIATDITDIGSFMIVANIVEEKLQRTEKILKARLGEAWLEDHNTRGFYVVIDGVSFTEGVRSLISVSGLGRLKPNNLLLGFQTKWKQNSPEERSEYYEVIRMGFEQELSVCVLRMDPLKSKSTANSRLKVAKLKEKAAQKPQSISRSLMHLDSEEEFEALAKRKTANEETILKEVELKQENLESTSSKVTTSPQPGALKGKVVSKVLKETQLIVWDECTMAHKTFSRTLGDIRGNSSWMGGVTVLLAGDFRQTLPDVPRGTRAYEAQTVDAWWLYDDGGLNILIPYIVARRRQPYRPLRIFAVSKFKIQGGKEKMENLLKKYRIEYDMLTMLTEMHKDPTQASCEIFNDVIDEVSPSDNPMRGPKPNKKLQIKTKRHLRVKELLMEHSSRAELIVLSLPYPRKDVSPVLFLAWLEILSVNLPPVLFVRGTQMPVLDS